MNILVTGGAGFIGSHTVVELINTGHTPIILDNLCNSRISSLDGIRHITKKYPKFYKGDCTDLNFVTSIFSSNPIDGIIHFSALKAVGESITNPLLYYQNNIDSLITILKCAVHFHTRYIVFSSSATVYGEPETLPIPETAPRKKASSPYGNTKKICEDILRDTQLASTYALQVIILRYFNPIGAHPSGFIGELPLSTPNNLVPFITQTAAGIRERLTIFGDDYPTPDGTCIRDYIHVVDLAKAHIRALEHLCSHKEIHYTTYNVGTGKGTSVKELLNTFQDVNNITVPHIIGPRRVGDIISCYANSQKIEEQLKWKARLSLKDALKDAWHWQKTLKI